MKKEIYLLNSANEQSPLGNLSVSENYQTIEINLDDVFKEKYSSAISRVVERINEDGNFGVNINQDFKLENTSETFFGALLQTFITDLSVILEKENH